MHVSGTASAAHPFDSAPGTPLGRHPQPSLGKTAAEPALRDHWQRVIHACSDCTFSRGAVFINSKVRPSCAKAVEDGTCLWMVAEKRGVIRSDIGGVAQLSPHALATPEAATVSRFPKVGRACSPGTTSTGSRSNVAISSGKTSAPGHWGRENHELSSDTGCSNQVRADWFHSTNLFPAPRHFYLACQRQHATGCIGFMPVSPFVEPGRAN